MKEQPLITVHMHAYNSKQYIRKAVDSVLNQTYTHIQFELIDNGSTDGTSAILQEYAGRDSRIQLITLEKNQRGIIGAFPQKYAKGVYFTAIDSDDWWEPDYLERMLKFVTENDLDMGMTGTWTNCEESGKEEILRRVDTPILLTRREFAEQYEDYWKYASTVWGNLIKTELLCRENVLGKEVTRIPYGGDTAFMLNQIAKCDRVGIDNTALYHYRIHNRSSSFHFTADRLDGNVRFIGVLESFLQGEGVYSQDKKNWLAYMYLGQVDMTLYTHLRTKESLQVKLRECVRALELPGVVTLLKRFPENLANMWEMLQLFLALNMGQWPELDIRDLQKVVGVISPDCVPCLTAESTGFFAQNNEAGLLLLKNERESLLQLLLDAALQPGLNDSQPAEMLWRLAEEPLLSTVKNTAFIRQYPVIYGELLYYEYEQALNDMLSLFVQQEQLPFEEELLELFVNTAAQMEQSPAFIYGKIRTAYLYLRENRREECRILLEELTRMGIEAGELEHLREALEQSE